jgi:single-strand DNA-binding protein
MYAGKSPALRTEEGSLVMANEPLITIVGNAAGDCDLRFAPSGIAVAAFTVAVTPRIKQGEEWKDGETTWFRCTAWRDMAERCSESITKGMRLIVHGRFKTRQYDKDGVTRTSIEIDVDEVGPSLRYATATVNKMQRSGGQDNGGGQREPARTGGRPQQPDPDPWGGGGFGGGEEPPFAP